LKPITNEEYNEALSQLKQFLTKARVQYLTEISPERQKQFQYMIEFHEQRYAELNAQVVHVEDDLNALKPGPEEIIS
jgi:hypothetical protein